MICYHKEIEKKDLGGGVLFQYLGIGKNMNVFHWNMNDGSVVIKHNHPEEQFGYVIKGGFEAIIEDEKFTLSAGDAYFIPPNAYHSFKAIGDTEAIDVFAPIKQTIPSE